VPAADPERIASARPVITTFKAEYGRPEDYGPYTVAAYDATGTYAALIPLVLVALAIWVVALWVAGPRRSRPTVAVQSEGAIRSAASAEVITG